MKAKVRVDLSRRCTCVMLALCMAIGCGFVMKHLAAQVEGENAWRRTVRGWEYVHSVQADSSPRFLSRVQREPSAVSSIRQWHRIVLPVAASCFMITFGCWALLEIPNQGIIRRLGE